ncbi:uncharacterized protein ALTATR162_LOCUS3546 [Alternaria atra]|uniref:Uncharacterized protein n=1 Tax=Alternaria atra TaxID=119953 RepID=A0A8J2HWX2_9PLEO|nr:uncharacterized protein ALTATR162_LOCUS3546 [Alternaria atra]CAG5154290.1 unnamed protein product [Alternaria atra]
MTSESFRNMAYKFLLASLPFAGSALYLTYLHITLSRSVQCQTTPYLQDKSIAIPDTVQNSSENYIIHHECTRKKISTVALGASKPEMMVLFLRHTMATFSKRPPAWGIWYMIKDAKDRNTFNSAYIRSLQFVLGDRVCGVYVVTSRDKERITLTLDAPGSYKGPLVEGMLVVEVKEEGDQTTFINHTVMWREKGKGNAGVLEGVVGRWMHGLMVRGLIESGVQKLSAEIEEKKRL